MRDVELKSIEELRRALAESERRYEELKASVDARAKEIAKNEFQTEMIRISSELAHDLRGPLQIITNSLFLMERKPGDTTYYPKINEALRQSTGLLDAFREYYRGYEVALMKGSVNRLVERSLEGVVVPPGVIVTKSLDPNLPDTILDLGKMKRVFTVVLKNAIEAMPNGGSLNVSSRADGKRIVVQIKDTGMGIPEAIREKVFVAFGAKKRGDTASGWRRRGGTSRRMVARFHSRPRRGRARPSRFLSR